jgi:hypothetical protein
MSHETQFNTRMPFMPFNWFTHGARVGKLSMTERGVFDAVRSELWKVVGCKVPRASLMAQLRVKSASPTAKALDVLIDLGLLKVDDDGLVYDEVQVHEFLKAVEKAEVNRANGQLGGRPRNRPATTARGTPPGSPEDF